MMEELNKLKTCKIFLVEDDEDDFYFFNLALSSLGGSYQLLRAPDGVMFCSLIQTTMDIDVIFLDINMPYKDGVACLKEIRSMEAYNSIKIVMYSTSDNVKDIDRCYSMGADFYLVKPSCDSSASQQLKDLFENNYFIRNIKPPREEFVFYSARSNAEKRHYHFNHQGALHRELISNAGNIILAFP
jgi:CheY-like chemotaxis protein